MSPKLTVLLLVALLAVVHTSPLSAKASDRYDEDLELEEFEDEFTVEEMNEVDEDTMIELFGDEAEEPISCESDEECQGFPQLQFCRPRTEGSFCSGFPALPE